MTILGLKEDHKRNMGITRKSLVSTETQFRVWRLKSLRYYQWKPNIWINTNGSKVTFEIWKETSKNKKRA